MTVTAFRTLIFTLLLTPSSYAVDEFHLHDSQHQSGNWPSDDQNSQVFYGQARNHLPILDRFYQHERLYYQMRWSEHSLAIIDHPAAPESMIRWQYRLHFPIWKMVSIAPGFELSYADGEQLIENTGIAYRRLAAGLGGRVQAGFGRGFFTVAPYFDLGSDFVSRRWVQSAQLEGYEDGRADTDKTNQKLAIGLNFYFDVRTSSLGFGLESGLIWGEAGSATTYQAVQISWRSP